MSSPNISPIKPVMSVPETPTSVRRPRLFRHSVSPMECSVNVLESSGIEVIGDALPDLSPIKGPEETSIGRVQKMDIDNGKFRNLKKILGPNVSMHASFGSTWSMACAGINLCVV